MRQVQEHRVWGRHGTQTERALLRKHMNLAKPRKYMLTILARQLGLWLTSPVLLVRIANQAVAAHQFVFGSVCRPQEDAHHMRVANLDVRTRRLDSDSKDLLLDQIFGYGF